MRYQILQESRQKLSFIFLSFIFLYFIFLYFIFLYYRELEHMLMIIATHYLLAANTNRNTDASTTHRKSSLDRVDLDAYGLRNVDRFSVLLDVWRCEESFQEKKRQLFDCFLEAYHHITDSNDQRKMTQVTSQIVTTKGK